MTGAVALEKKVRLINGSENMAPTPVQAMQAPPPPAAVTKPAEADDFSALAAAATPLKNISNTSALTPWGYPTRPDEKVNSGKSSSGTSWQTIRAGLLSPPPLIASLLSPPPDGVEAVEQDEIVDECEEAPTGEEP